MKRKNNMFFNFQALSLTRLVLIQSTQFSVVVSVYDIHVFDEAFFLLTSRMPIATKIFRVVT